MCYNIYSEREVITMQFLINYEIMLQALKNGDITKEQWDKYCLCCLDELLEQNQDILKRLKDI